MTGMSHALSPPTASTLDGSPTRRRTTSGSVPLDDLYKRARRTMTQRRMGQLSMIPDDRGPAWASLVIAGTWRADQDLATGRLELLQWHELVEQWQPVEQWSYFPDLQLLPLRGGKSPTPYLKGALNLLLDNLGWGSEAHWDEVLRAGAVRGGYAWPEETLPWTLRRDHLRAVMANEKVLERQYDQPRDDDRRAWWKGAGMEIYAELHRHRYRMTRIQQVLVDEMVRGPSMSAQVNQERQDQASRGLVKRLWGQAIDPDLLKLVGLARMRQPVRWSDFVEYARHAVALRKVAREHRNLVPLLDRIRPKYWSRPNLFSRRRWVRDGRKEMVIESSTFGRVPPVLRGTNPGRALNFVAFEHPAAFRWMLKASPLVINRWLSQHHGNGAILERCVRMNLPTTTSPLIWDAVMRRCDDLQERGNVWFTLPNDPVQRPLAMVRARDAMDRALRLYALHLQDEWATQGLRKMLQRMARDDHPVLDVLDWIRGEAGALGLPDKNARWDSMVRAAQAWHLRRQQEAEWESQPFEYTWFCPWGDPEVLDDVRVTPLTSSTMLWAEGELMKHCVGWNGYDTWCYDGSAQIFSLLDQTSQTRIPVRSTLCLNRSAAHRTWTVQQNRSYHNQMVTPRLMQVGKLVAQRLNERESAFIASGEPWPASTRVPRNPAGNA